MSLHSLHSRGRTLATARSAIARSPASISTSRVDANISAPRVRNVDVLPTPLGPTIRILGPLFCARRSSAVKIFMCVPLRALGRHHDLGGKLKRDNDQERLAIGADDQKVTTVKPLVDFAESISATFRFTA